MFRKSKGGEDGNGAQDPAREADPSPPPAAAKSPAPRSAPDVRAVDTATARTVRAPAAPARPEPARPGVSIPPAPRRPERPAPAGEGKKLLVGRDIHLAGEITSCERLIVEGRVEAALKDCRSIEISETGFFKGTAEVEVAEISGLFEGEIVARERLLVRNTGRIAGTVRYGRIEIEPGGEINGDVASLARGKEQPQLFPVGEPAREGPKARPRPPAGKGTEGEAGSS